MGNIFDYGVEVRISKEVRVGVRDRISKNIGVGAEAALQRTQRVGIEIFIRVKQLMVVIYIGYRVISCSF